ncbi:MAG: hypothetical protein DMF69_06210 [Acidobacteria bacterium]|nr:MAG: hypothetical protein DMF69_06210 [Acidobacteriota bacterium]
MVEGYAERKTIVLARSGPNEWEGNWRATGGPPFTEGTRRSDALLRIRIVSDGNGKAHYFVNDVTEQNPMSYTANEILVSYRTYIRQR